MQAQSFKKIKQNAKVLNAIIKLQALYRGHRVRKMIKTHSHNMKMGGGRSRADFGKSKSGSEYHS